MCKEDICRTIKPLHENQNDVIKNFAVVMNAVTKRDDCIIILPQTMTGKTTCPLFMGTIA